MPRYYSKLGSNGNLELAVAFLTAKNAKTPQQEETTYYQTVLPGSDRYISVGSQADAKEGSLQAKGVLPALKSVENVGRIPDLRTEPWKPFSALGWRPVLSRYEPCAWQR
nr:uncharacterized protein LOC123284638 isoform X4 [Equus asinus]